MGYHFGITPTLLVNLEIKITPGAYGLLHGKEICPKVRNSKPCNNIVGENVLDWYVLPIHQPLVLTSDIYTGWKI